VSHLHCGISIERGAIRQHTAEHTDVRGPIGSEQNVWSSDGSGVSAEDSFGQRIRSAELLGGDERQLLDVRIGISRLDDIHVNELPEKFGNLARNLQRIFRRSATADEMLTNVRTQLLRAFANSPLQMLGKDV
jgi:hypothetical protein